MPFIIATAGPSRVVRRLNRCLTQATSRAASATALPTVSDPAEDADDRDSRFAKLKEKQFHGTFEGYLEWLGKHGQQYASVAKGQKATWMGGSVPYMTNPSFKPPPPISNEMQDAIYQQLRRGKKTIGQLAELHNVSKARIEAIRKLKEVETEFRRQNLPLQHAFLRGMEPLLGVAQTKARPDPNGDDNPHDLKSTAVEREEEERLDAGIGQAGAFGNMMEQERSEGLERTVWEFRSEHMVMRERQAEAAAASKAHGEAEKLVAEQGAAPETPDHEQSQKRHVHAEAVVLERVVKAGRNAYRFVDTSTTRRS